jgi:hypothetical protein
VLSADPDPAAILEQRVRQVSPAATVTLVTLESRDRQDLLDLLASPDSRARKVAMPSTPSAVPDLVVSADQSVLPDLKETAESMPSPVPLDLRAHREESVLRALLVLQASLERKDRMAVPAATPSTARAPLATGRVVDQLLVVLTADRRARSLTSALLKMKKCLLHSEQIKN